MAFQWANFNPSEKGWEDNPRLGEVCSFQFTWPGLGFGRHNHALATGNTRNKTLGPALLLRNDIETRSYAGKPMPQNQN